VAVVMKSCVWWRSPSVAHTAHCWPAPALRRLFPLHSTHSTD
jgi:hypothetical protein